MEYTRIAGANEKSFAPLLAGMASLLSPSVVRLGALDDDKRIIGLLVAETGGIDLELLYLYVVPDWRRRGCARGLMELLFSLFTEEKESGQVLLYRAIRAVYPDSKELDGLFSSAGFDCFVSGRFYSVSAEWLFRSPMIKKYIEDRAPKGITPVASCKRSDYSIVKDYLAENELPPGGWFDPAISTVCIRGKAVSSMMLTKMHKGDLLILWLYTRDERSSVELLKHFRFLACYLKKKQGRRGGLRIRFAADDRMKTFAAGLVGGSRLLFEDGHMETALKLL